VDAGTAIGQGNRRGSSAASRADDLPHQCPHKEPPAEYWRQVQRGVPGGRSISFPSQSWLRPERREAVAFPRTTLISPGMHDATTRFLAPRRGGQKPLAQGRRANGSETSIGKVRCGPGPLWRYDDLLTARPSPVKSTTSGQIWQEVTGRKLGEAGRGRLRSQSAIACEGRGREWDARLIRRSARPGGGVPHQRDHAHSAIGAGISASRPKPVNVAVMGTGFGWRPGAVMSGSPAAFAIRGRQPTAASIRSRGPYFGA